MADKVMNKRVLTINLPHSVHLDDKDAKMRFACMLYEDGIISTGEAAEMVGISRREFIETMGKFGASIFQQTIVEVESDIKNA